MNLQDDTPAAKAAREVHVYTRESNPNTTRLEAILTSILHAPSVVYASGLAAAHGALALLNPRRISIGQGYHGVHEVIHTLHRLTCGQRFISIPLDCQNSDIGPGDVIWLETPINPHGTSYNISEYAEKAKSVGAVLVVDSTFAPPPLQDPFALGAGIVLHSGTKYLGGHSDVLYGVLASRSTDWVAQLKNDRSNLGSVMGNMEAWLAVRSLRTLNVRVERQSHNAERLVSWLSGMLSPPPTLGKEAQKREDTSLVCSVVDEVYHCSLQNHDMSWLRGQMPHGFGPVFSLTLNDENLARLLPTKLRLFQHATSLGGVESLIEWRAMSDATVDRRLLRISVGLEDWEDLRDDLLQGLKAIAA